MSTGPGSPFHEMLQAHLRIALAKKAELKIHSVSDSEGLPGQPALDRDDDVNLGRSTANPLWDPAMVDRRIDELFNGRWTRSWRRSGEETVRPPMIEETDASGVDRRDIGRWISPTELEQLAQQTRWIRAKQVACGEQQVYSFQHLLVQALQTRVAQAQLHVQPNSMQTVEAGRPWAVGDLVNFCGEQYFITAITPRKITCESERSGAFDVTPNSMEARGLKLIAAGLRLAAATE